MGSKHEFFLVFFFAFILGYRSKNELQANTLHFYKTASFFSKIGEI